MNLPSNDFTAWELWEDGGGGGAEGGGEGAVGGGGLMKKREGSCKSLFCNYVLHCLFCNYVMHCFLPNIKEEIVTFYESSF